jgi:DNA-binding NarL/FixJ family response regulator
MLNALRQVHEQGTFLTSSITQEVFQEYSQNGRNGKEDGHPLTERERQVLQLVVEGKSNKEIAMVLGISPKTVSVHRTNIMSKLNVQNTVELIRYATSNPFISLPVPD